MNPIFTVDCITTDVKGLTGRGLSYVKQAMTAKPEGYQFMPSYKKGWWDGNICLYTPDNSFPSGLLFLAAEELNEANIPFQVIDNQPQVKIELDLDLGQFEFRDYQLEATQIALEDYRGILKMATNSGKTLVTAGIVKSTGCDALIVVPSKPLLHQSAEFYAKVLGVPVGKVGDNFMEPDKPVVVTTMASFKKIPDLRQQFNTLILDETHHGKAKSILEPAQYIMAPIRIGVSGTPLSYNRLNDLNLMGVTGPLLYEVSNTDLIEAGYSVRPIIIFHEISKPDIPKKTKYQDAYDLCIVHNYTRNKLIADITLDSPGLTLILVERLDHVDNLLQLIPNAVPATGATDNVAILFGMKHAKYAAVVATNVFSEGIDADGIDNIILAGAGVSHIRLLQRIGRGLRFREGKNEVIIHDFIDSSSKYLLEQSDQRLSTYESEGFEVSLAEL